jgi:hypothetical protein
MADHWQDSYNYVRIVQAEPPTPLPPPPAKKKPAMPRKLTPAQRSANLLNMLSMRMDGVSKSRMIKRPKFEYIYAHELEEEVVIFVVAKGGPVMLKDDIKLYPSDALVTQVRLLNE